MRVISCSVKNFSSYKDLEFSFENQGLTLIQGPTGSGKSTLCDVIPWILYGRTAKDGAVDEVISWNAEGPTEGTLHLSIGDKLFTIVRSRKPNDLYFYEYIDYADSTPQRGKDLNDTQKLINDLIGADVNTYLSAAYFHEFSPAAQFFIANAKNRRQLCEQLVDLSLEKTLQVNLSTKAKGLNKAANEHSGKIQLYADRIHVLMAKNIYLAKAADFQKEKAAAIATLQNKILEISSEILPQSYFEQAAANIKDQAALLGSDRCSECGSKKNGDKWETLKLAEMKLKQEAKDNQTLKQEIANLKDAIERENSRENTYIQLEEARQKDIKTATAKREEAKALLDQVSLEVSDIELLLEVVQALRTVSIQNAIQNLESNVNQLLNDHYDAEIRVSFLADNADKLDVSITKDGNLCSFSQLSKGQRCLLKLCFGVAAMRSVANHGGVNFNAIFLDESMDGMDDNFKIKTYRLLEGIAQEHESVFVVEHSEAIKSLFHNKYSVQLVNGESIIEKAE